MKFGDDFSETIMCSFIFSKGNKVIMLQPAMNPEMLDLLEDFCCIFIVILLWFMVVYRIWLEVGFLEV
jgi:hypothetical protein